MLAEQINPQNIIYIINNNRIVDCGCDMIFNELYACIVFNSACWWWILDSILSQKLFLFLTELAFYLI